MNNNGGAQVLKAGETLTAISKGKGRSGRKYLSGLAGALLSILPGPAKGSQQFGQRIRADKRLSGERLPVPGCPQPAGNRWSRERFRTATGRGRPKRPPNRPVRLACPPARWRSWPVPGHYPASTESIWLPRQPRVQARQVRQRLLQNNLVHQVVNRPREHTVMRLR